MSAAPGGATRAGLFVFLLSACVSGSLLARAWLAAPEGTRFAGTFAYVDDFYNYLAMAEQAQRGELLFRSKMASPALPAALVNLEWLSVGWLAAALGGRPVLAYRLFGLIALAALVWAADRWLAGCGVPRERQLAALLLVFTGGGLGGLAYALGLLPGERAFDLRTGAYPFVEVLANPHFTTGTALLAGALAAFASGRRALGAALGAALGLVRPYDAALLGAVEAAAIAVVAPARQWLRRAWPLLALLPSLGHSGWVFRASPGFRAWVSPGYAEHAPSLGEWLVLIGPAGLLALAGHLARNVEPSADERAHLLRLRLWSGIALAVAVLRPVTFSLQFAVGIGLPLLALAAAGLARLRPPALAASVPLMSTSACVMVWLCTLPTPRTHPPSERWRVAEALAAVCRPRELVLAPADIGLYVGGLTPCWPFVSHPAAPDHATRLATLGRFYDPAAAAGERARLLDRECISHVVLPAGAPPGWLRTSEFRPSLTVRERGGALSVWSRPPPPRCTSPRP